MSEFSVVTSAVEDMSARVGGISALQAALRGGAAVYRAADAAVEDAAGGSERG